MTLAGQDASTSQAQAATLAHHRHLRRDHIRLECGGELLRLRQTQTKVGQANLFVALEARKFPLRRQARLQLCNQLHPPHQLRHQLTLVP
jgi:hypothetical protein